MSATLRLAVAGAPGRMAEAVIAAAAGRADVEVVAVFGRAERVGETLAGLSLCAAEEGLGRADVVVDFSTAEASVGLVGRLAAYGGPAVVIGATGFTANEESAIEAAAGAVTMVKSGNFSIGVNLLAGLIEQAARRLGPDAWDAEIFEAHHRRKRDAPSGTALLLAGAVADGRGVSLDEALVSARVGVTGPRLPGAIGVSVMRGGGIVGEHSVVFAAEDEIITLSHSARDRSLFARGAIEAALWVAGRPPGLYSMADVLGLSA